MTKRMFGIGALLLVVAACGPTQGNPSSPVGSPGSSPTSSSPLLFAVLEANGSATASTYNTVVIAGLDGSAKARATFAPMPVPNLGCFGAILPQSAHVAAGKVYYADAKGVVRSLAIDGTIKTEATFPMASAQQMLSFAVSPDGTRLLGTIFTAPTDANPCSASPSTGTYSYDAYAATSGGPTQLRYHESWTNTLGHQVMALTGWDDLGPIGTFPTVWASQGGGPGSTLGVFVRIDASTVKPLAPFADLSQCRVWDSIASGAFVCMGDATVTAGGTADQRVAQSVSVRRADGTELWHSTVTGQNSPFAPFLAPDGEHLMICCNDLDLADPHELLVGRDGTQVNLAKGFYATGWLNAGTEIGFLNLDPQQQSPPMAYVSATAPGTIVSMGFSGTFVGTVQG